MKIKIKKDEFLNSLNIVSRALKKGNLYQILDCILIDASKDNIFLVSQDGKEITIKTQTEGIIEEKGKAVIEGDKLIRIIRNMPSFAEIELSVNDKKECKIICENQKYNFQSKDESTYPNIVLINKDKKVTLNELKIKKILDKTIFSYDRTSESGNIILKGIYFNINKEDFIAKSMDGYIISIVNEKLNNNDLKHEVIVPGSALEELNKLIKGEVNKDVNIYFSDKNISFEFNNTIFTSIIIPNAYIDTDRIFNLEYSTKVNINKQRFIESLLSSTAILNNNEDKPVILDISDDLININLNTLDGDYNDKIEVQKKGKDLMIAFNANKLVKVLNPIEDENITLYFSGSKNPVIIKDKQETYSYLLTPVKM